MESQMVVRADGPPGPGRFNVEVQTSEQTFHFTVTVDGWELDHYGKGRSPQDLVRASFAFLLAREPPTSILPTFALSTIERYFPDFSELV